MSEGLAAMLRSAFGAAPPMRVGVALSGGGDSMALLQLMADWRDAGGPEVLAATVDHGLRAASRAEAEAAGRAAAARGVAHDILTWAPPARGNLEASARAGRYDLLAGWARARGLGDVALGHTAEDQAETVLMRLARGSGVDGLSGMAGLRAAGGIRWWRPLLAARRADLRGVLRGRGVGWAEDPMNEDPAFDRVKARQALALLAPLGVTVEGLVATAGWMARAREALNLAAVQAESAVWRQEGGCVVFAAGPFLDLPEESRMRLLSGALRWVASAPYRPRLADLRGLHDALAAGPCRRTLSGCVVARAGGALRVSREPRAAGGAVPFGAVWDGRWHVAGPGDAGLHLAALGAAGLAALPDAPRPRAPLAVTPAIWRGAALVAAPCAGLSAGFSAEIRPSFAASLLAH